MIALLVDREGRPRWAALCESGAEWCLIDEDASAGRLDFGHAVHINVQYLLEYIRRALKDIDQAQEKYNNGLIVTAFELVRSARESLTVVEVNGARLLGQPGPEDELAEELALAVPSMSADKEFLRGLYLAAQRSYLVTGEPVSAWAWRLTEHVGKEMVEEYIKDNPYDQEADRGDDGSEEP